METDTHRYENEAYSVHFQNLRKKGAWQIHLKGNSCKTKVLAAPGKFARQNLLYLESIVLYHNTPMGFYVHRQDYHSYQIVYTLSGCGQLEYAGKSYHMGAGDCFLIDCCKEHCYFTEGEEDWLHHGIQFDGHQMSAVFTYLTQLDSVVVSLGDADHINSIHEQLADYASSKLVSADLFINQLLMDLVSKMLLCNQLTSDAELSPKINEVCAYIDSNYPTISSLEEIAKRCYISKFYMCHEFRKQTGKTIGTYLSNCRMNAAKTLLLQTRDSVSDVAHSVGFQSENYFFNAFKKAEGITPFQYRKRSLG